MAKKEKPIKWENNPDFLNWMLSMEYARETPKGITPMLSLGCVLYMYEAWCACWVQSAAMRGWPQ